jgi:uroporphyrinogen-III synthase
MRPLEGRRIAVTRAEEQAGPLCSELEAAGAIPLRCATIRVTSPESFVALDEALHGLGDYDWLVFTSTNGVRATLDRMEELGLSLSLLHAVRVAAVGPQTARALLERGVHADFVPDEGRSEAVARELTPVEGARVLLARGDLADRSAERVLRERGASVVDAVVAYRTVPAAPSAQALEELSAGVDGITFTSPSTVRGFVEMGPRWRDITRGVVVATIGPTTTAAAREAGFDVRAEAQDRTMHGLVAALERGFSHGVPR